MEGNRHNTLLWDLPSRHLRDVFAMTLDLPVPQNACTRKSLCTFMSLNDEMILSYPSWNNGLMFMLETLMVLSRLRAIIKKIPFLCYIQEKKYVSFYFLELWLVILFTKIVHV